MMNNNKRGLHFDFDPYDWLIQVENRQIELENKYNIAIRNQKEMALAYNDLFNKHKELKKKLERLETDLWRAKNDNEAIERYYELMGRPERS